MTCCGRGPVPLEHQCVLEASVRGKCASQNCSLGSGHRVARIRRLQNMQNIPLDGGASRSRRAYLSPSSLNDGKACRGAGVDLGTSPCTRTSLYLSPSSLFCWVCEGLSMNSLSVPFQPKWCQSPTEGAGSTRACPLPSLQDPVK